MRSKLLTALINTLPRPHTPLLLPSTTLQPCTRYTNLPSLPPLLKPTHPHRTFTTTPHPLKKGGKQDSKRTVPLNAQKPSSSKNNNNKNDAFDLTDYTTAIARTHAALKAELAKIKAGGLDPDAVENTRVQLVKGERDARKAVRVGDVATVIVRGRNVAVLVGEKDHLKPLLSSLHASPANLHPTPSPTDPLTLLIPIPATTQESRRAAQAVAGKKGEEALFALREARGAQRKRHRGMALGRVVGPDELRSAEREVERVNGEAVGEAKKAVEGCRRGLEGG